MAIASVPAQAQDAAADVRVQLDTLQRELQAQRGLIDAQSKRLEEQQQEIARLRGEVAAATALDEERAAGLNLPQPSFGGGADELRGFDLRQGRQLAQVGGNPTPSGPGAALPQQPVGEDPNLPRVEQKVAAVVPENFGILSRPGKFTFEPSIDFVDSSRNRLVFRGFEITPGLPVGVIEASDVDRTTVVANGTIKFGLFKRFEVEARVPYIFRWDRFSFTQIREGQIVNGKSIKGSHLGDIEFAARYQINQPTGSQPIFTANLRVKSNTGLGPYEIPYDEFFIAEGVSTGSGFWAVQPGINMLLPSDPAVIFAGVNYIYHIGRNVNRVVGERDQAVFVGHVDPGDAINGNVGFAFALNQQFSFTLGYSHSYIFPTMTVLGTSRQKSDRLQSGSFSMGMAYAIADKRTINFSVGIGVTDDAPNVALSLRMPFQLN